MEIQEITYRGFDSWPALDALVRERAAGLERFFRSITSCRVAVELPHRRHETGNLYHVRIDLTVPGAELVVARDPQDEGQHADPLVAVNDAFDVAERRLQDYALRLRGDVKVHVSEPAVGRVVKLFPDQGYGFIESVDLRELWFHQNAVLDGDFPRLRIGDEVQYVEEESVKGPQAKAVSRFAGATGEGIAADAQRDA